MRTEIWDKGTARADRYAGTDYAGPLGRFRHYAEGLARDGYSPEEFGRFVRAVFDKERPKTRYPIVRGRLMNFTLPRLLPDRLLDRIIARSLGLT